jgi:lipoprotein-anchoring transpeptidase ErfK/SrfK
MIARWCLAVMAFFAPGSVAAVPPVGAPDMHEVAASLRPGAFHWDDVDADGAPVTLAVSIALQRLYVYRGDALVGVTSISTGKRGKATPLGEFALLQKSRWHRSNLYSNAPMPFMQRLTWTGIALHAGTNPGYPASHGCIRMPFEFARRLFGMTALGDPVTVADYPVQSPVYLVVEDFDGTAPLLTYAPDVFG